MEAEPKSEWQTSGGVRSLLKVSRGTFTKPKSGGHTSIHKNWWNTLLQL